MYRHFLFIFISLSLAINALAAVTDEEGMPVVYLRGSFSELWQPMENYKFSRSGNLYTLIIDEHNALPPCQFKIADEEWGFDYGAPEEGINIDSSQTLEMAHAGKNINTQGFSKATISFQYSPHNCVVNFNIEGKGSLLESQLSGQLPVFYINVYADESHTTPDNEIIDYYLNHKDYFNNAEYWVDTNGCTWMEEIGAESVGSKEEPLPLQIKARGNWTRIGFSKKPFKIKLDKKQNLLGLTPKKSKHYALLAHADDDNGFLRNYTTFNLGKRIGLPWTPGMQPVELVINGDYRGLYFLTESIRIDEGRIEIAELDDNVEEPELISGGYVVELDNYDEENQIRMEEKSCADGQHLDLLRITYDTPEIYSAIQQKFVTEQFEAMNNAVGANDDILWTYLDLDDVARYYIVREIASDTEAFHGSTYLFRDRGEGRKWHFSPLWDAGNAFQGSTSDFFYNCDPFGNTWIPSLRENTKFNDKVSETWLWFMQKRFNGIFDDIDEYALHISKAAECDHKRWKNEPWPDGGRGVADNSDMARKASEVKSILEQKTEWLKGCFGDYALGNHNEPDRDLTPAASLPDYAKSGIEDIFTDDDNSLLEIYNLQGIKIANPVKGQIYILKKGSKTLKVVY